MRRVAFIVISNVLATGAFAQAPVKTPAFETLIALPLQAAPPGATEAFATLRAAVAAKDAGRLKGLLAPDFAALACSGDPTLPCAPGRSPSVPTGKTPLDRLRLALCCGGRDDKSIDAATRDEALWGLLASLLATNAAPALGATGGDAVCQPAIPIVDRPKLKALAKSLDLEPTAFRLAAEPVAARTRADRAAPVVATLPKGAVVPLLTGPGVTVPDGWTALALSAGGVGFAEGVTLDELAPEALCVRPTRGGWRLALLIGRQN